MAHLFGISVSDSFLSWILLGLLAGWIAGLISGRGFGFLGDILVGLIGSVLGGWIFFRLGILGGADSYTVWPRQLWAPWRLS
jgi:uncharacterized membrane protein YeaQ/YmgE (transglycosylase-associated protein family)